LADSRGRPQAVAVELFCAHSVHGCFSGILLAATIRRRRFRWAPRHSVIQTSPRPRAVRPKCSLTWPQQVEWPNVPCGFGICAVQVQLALAGKGQHRAVDSRLADCRRC
jgi:hypothetical protein